jgi:hypothetical protein
MPAVTLPFHNELTRLPLNASEAVCHIICMLFSAMSERQFMQIYAKNVIASWIWMLMPLAVKGDFRAHDSGLMNKGARTRSCGIINFLIVSQKPKFPFFKAR